ncbi:MAG: ATP synthase F1 subunit delta [Bacteroidetes bacterium]|nr:ATP synthase F1 subunit delta [Bacteroidota bacterium]
MKGTRVATRYAKSLLKLSTERGELERVFADMQLIYNTHTGSKDLELFLKSPIIKSDKKDAVLGEIFGDKISKITKEFIEIIVRKKREEHLGIIAESFVNQYREQKKILTAVVTTAIGLDDSIRTKVLELIKKSAKGEVEIQEHVDKDIIGGFVLRVGDKQIDASIARKLKQLASNFSDNPYVKEF